MCASWIAQLLMKDVRWSDVSRVLFTIINFAGSSPIVLQELDNGWHSFKIVPVGDDCIDRQPLSLSFMI